MTRAGLISALILAAACQKGDRAAKGEASFVVTLSKPGSAPADLDRDVAVPLAQALRDVPGVIRVETRAGADVVHAHVTMAPSDTPAIERGRQAIADLPALGDLLPTISRAPDPSTRTSWFVLRGELATADVVKSRLERVSGVLRVDLCGEPREEIVVWVGERASPLKVADALRLRDLSVPAGRVEAGSRELTVRSVGAYDDIASLPVDAHLLREVASLEVAPSPSRCRAVAGGAPVVGGTITARADARPAIEQALAETRQILPRYTTVTLLEAREAMIAADEMVAGELLMVDGGVVTVVPAIPGTPGARIRSDETTLTLTGESWAAVAEAARVLAEQARAAGATAAGTDGGATRVARHIVIDRTRAAELQVPASDLARLIRIAVAGEVVGRSMSGKDLRDVRVRGDLSRMMVGGGLPLSFFVKTEERVEVVEIVRRDGAIVVDVWATPRDFDLRALAAKLPAGVEVRVR